MDNSEENIKNIGQDGNVLSANELEGVSGGEGGTANEMVVAYYEDGVYRSKEYADLYVNNPVR